MRREEKRRGRNSRRGIEVISYISAVASVRGESVQQLATAVVVYVRKYKDDHRLQAAPVVGPESLPRQLPVSHPELIAEDV